MGKLIFTFFTKALKYGTVMPFKISTKEKFHEIQVLEHQLTANVAAELEDTCADLQQGPVKNIILQLSSVVEAEATAAEKLVLLQQRFYEQQLSFIICEVTPQLEERLDDLHLLETLNPVPTLSEAWDMVQMEEIEREFLDDED
jgi:anti-anti-sigma regulatory factor